MFCPKWLLTQNGRVGSMILVRLAVELPTVCFTSSTVTQSCVCRAHICAGVSTDPVPDQPLLNAEHCSRINGYCSKPMCSDSAVWGSHRQFSSCRLGFGRSILYVCTSFTTAGTPQTSNRCFFSCAPACVLGHRPLL